MIAYLDSSAILKQYLLDEPGLAHVHAIATEAAVVATSRLSYVEVHAGLAGARRARRLDRVGHDRAVASFIDAWHSYLILELSEGVGELAGAIAAAFGLRAGDAIQLASMLELDPRAEVIVVAWDSNLRTAASAAGLMVFPPSG